MAQHLLMAFSSALCAYLAFKEFGRNRHGWAVIWLTVAFYVI